MQTAVSFPPMRPQTLRNDDNDDDPSTEWPEIHEAIKAAITELDGKVVPKLNWSAPKDATWISATNSMECRTPNDIYLLLKSSNFITHDLQHPFDDCVDERIDTSSDPTPQLTLADIPYNLVLRKHFIMNPSVEFRCFVRRRRLLAICQRDLNYFEFLFSMTDDLRRVIQRFFDEKLRDTFPDESYTFDVYLPPPHRKVWLIDFNPWAPRTDPLLFGWTELLTMPEPDSRPRSESSSNSKAQNSSSPAKAMTESNSAPAPQGDPATSGLLPEFRLVKRDDPEAYGFNSPQYGAHKLPREVVDASKGGEGGLREFAERWKDILAKRQEADADSGDERP